MSTAAIANATSALSAFELARLAKAETSRVVAPASYSTASDVDSDCASSIGCDEPVITPFLKPSATVPTAAVLCDSSKSALAALPHDQLVEVMTLAMVYMPLETIEVAREVAPAFAEAADRVAPHPLPGAPVTFVRWQPSVVPQPFKLPPTFHRSMQYPGGPSMFAWRCLSCANLTFGPRACAHCRAPIATSACRVFLGQLRKELTAELATYLLQSLLPDVCVLHVESHTNPNDGRGRGCAWVYVDSLEDARRVVSLHKRIFVDVDCDGFEGFWYVKDHALVPTLTQMADVIGAVRQRPQILPRQPLVAELPGKSVLASMLAGF